MPSVNLSPETYAKLEARARTQHATPDSIAEAVVRAHIDDAPTWADHWASIEAKPSEALTEEEANFEVDRATDEVRAKRYARTLSEEQLVSEWQRALAGGLDPASPTPGPLMVERQGQMLDLGMVL